MHCRAPKEGASQPNSTSAQGPGSAPLTALLIPSGSQAEREILHKATLTPQCSPGLLAYFLLPSMAPSGN